MKTRKWSFAISPIRIFASPLIGPRSSHPGLLIEEKINKRVMFGDEGEDILRFVKSEQECNDDERIFFGESKVELFGEGAESRVWKHQTLYCPAAKSLSQGERIENTNRVWVKWKRPGEFDEEGLVVVLLRPSDWVPKEAKLRLVAVEKKSRKDEKTGWRTFEVSPYVAPDLKPADVKRINALEEEVRLLREGLDAETRRNDALSARLEMFESREPPLKKHRTGALLRQMHGVLLQLMERHKDEL